MGVYLPSWEFPLLRLKIAIFDLSVLLLLSYHQQGVRAENEQPPVVSSPATSQKGVQKILSRRIDEIINTEDTSSASCYQDYELVFDDQQNACVMELVGDTTNSNGGNDPAKNVTDINIAGLFDTVNYEWATDIFEFTMQVINTPGEIPKIWPEVEDFAAPMQLGGFRFTYDIYNAACDETTASRVYWKSRRFGRPPHGVIGGRCSSASMSISRIAENERVPQISPSSTSSALSNDKEFPFFSRMLGPDNENGEIGATIAMLDHFGWKRVILISADEQYSKDWAIQFNRLWTNETAGREIGDNFVVEILPDSNAVDENSVKRVLNQVPVDNPRDLNSRIIVLAVINEHAFPILKIAKEIGFQPDTIWVGPASLAGRYPSKEVGTDWMPENPGYITIAPLQNSASEVHRAFMAMFQNWLDGRGESPSSKSYYSNLPVFAAQFADSVLVLSWALSRAALGGGDLRGGEEIVKTIRSFSFSGVGGHIEFTENGDLKNPQYSILHLRSAVGSSASDYNAISERHVWENIGTIGTQLGSGKDNIDKSKLCFPEIGCNKEIPSDKYPIPRERLPPWTAATISVVVILLFFVSIKYWRSKVSKFRLKKFQDSVIGMQIASSHFLPNVTNYDYAVHQGGQEKGNHSIGEHNGDVEDQTADIINADVEMSPERTVIWCWKETRGAMSQHPVERIFGDPADCWIKYDNQTNSEIEDAYLAGRRSFSPLAGYTIDFTQFLQINNETGFEREVQCFEGAFGGVQEELSNTKGDILGGLHLIDKEDVMIGQRLPLDIKSEPQMVLVKGDIIQVSKKRPDGWAFGTKLYHKDEKTARVIVDHINKKSRNAPSVSSDEEGEEGQKQPDDAKVFADTGWFQLDATCEPSPEDLISLKENVGDTGELERPNSWAPMEDDSRMEKHKIPSGDPEYRELEDAFMSTLKNRGVEIHRIERIQNLAMWQSYVVKRQTICRREISMKSFSLPSSSSLSSRTPGIDLQREALKRYERRWLWHGTNVENLDKILHQGFNRSFCGRNASLCGKGVYFARDAAYSSYPKYAVPDSRKHQYILACRVAVGEYCLGTENALTPAVRDADSHMLFDSTVGLLRGDDMSRPSIYVTYHDAQAYPEVSAISC